MQVQDSYTQLVETMAFINDEETAEEAVKAVLGMIASSLSDQEAREFTAHLPDWLDYDTLRGHQENTRTTSADESIQILKNKFNLDDKKARALRDEVIAITANESSGAVSQMINILSDDWKEVFDQAPK
ncbi:MAG: DUF2267 domain-containing protein [Balneolaceae bacterium]